MSGGRTPNQPALSALSARELLAANIIRLRRARGWSQEDLALETGLHRTFIAHTERLVRNISLDNIERIARALGVPTYKLLMPTKAKGNV
ncbi:MAG: helix-turn-helix transcriptional regulator [Rhizobacter sp.]|nr:helix-turn-helix transcriptional regulator [Rhizobacter sp.]